MPTSLPAVFPTKINDPTEFFGMALIMTWAISMLLFGVVTRFDAETAASGSFELLATF
jgi:hypothetical protein